MNQPMEVGRLSNRQRFISDSSNFMFNVRGNW